MVLEWWIHGFMHLSKPIELHITKHELQSMQIKNVSSKYLAFPECNADCERLN